MLENIPPSLLPDPTGLLFATTELSPQACRTAAGPMGDAYREGTPELMEGSAAEEAAAGVAGRLFSGDRFAGLVQVLVFSSAL
jgi:hypothetical protein